MAEKKFSELTAKGATIADTDIVAISESAGGGTYTSKSVTGANIKALVTDANMTTTDITTNDVSTSKHGFAPKAPNDTTKFLRGDATWAAVPAGGLTKFTEAEATTSPNNTVYVDSLTAAGSTTNADIAIVPKGTGAILADIPDNAASGGNKRGTNAVDLQINRGQAYQVASGNYSTIIGGAQNAATGDYSIAGGVSSEAATGNSIALGAGARCNAGSLTSVAIGGTINQSGSYAYAIGYNLTATGSNNLNYGLFNITSGSASQSFGLNCSATGQSSTANGVHAHTFGIFGRYARSTNRISTDGDSQFSKFILKIRTTNATATTLTADNSAASATNQVILSNQSAYGFTGTIVGKESGSTNAAMWKVEGLISRGANAASTVLTTSTVTLVSNAPGWGTPTLAADTTNGGLKVQVIGATTTNIQWTGVIETTEVIYA